MPTNWGDFRTVRGAIPYSMDVNMIHEDYPTSGEMKTFRTLCRVKTDRRDEWLAAMLPDVDDAIVTGAAAGQDLEFLPYGNLTGGSGGPPPTTPATLPRKALNRKLPEPHPIFTKAWCRQVTLIRGEGYMTKGEDFWPTFRDWDARAEESKEGFLVYAVTWTELPYPLTLGNTKSTPEGRRGVPDEDGDNLEVNGALHSELERYCYTRVSSSSQSLQVRGTFLYFIKPDGTVLLRDGKMVPVPDGAQAIPFGSALFTVTWYMIPYVPRTIWTLRNCLNRKSNVYFDNKIVPTASAPEIEALLYKTPEITGPYYTISNRNVYDVTLNFLYRPGGFATARGQNAIFCPLRRDFLRVVAGPPNTTDTGFDTTADPDLTTLPSDGTPITTARKQGHNVYDVADLSNLWKMC